MVPINGNPMLIVHNFNKYPSVTVSILSRNAEKEEAVADIFYVDSNTIRVSWDIEESLEGFIYIV